MLRGRCSRAIPERATPVPFVSSSLSRPLTPLFPVHTRHSPVSPTIPVHTQKHGGGGLSCKIRSPLTLLFSSTMLTSQLRAIVGAPTILERPASEGGPYTSFAPPLSFSSDLLLATSHS